MDSRLGRRGGRLPVYHLSHEQAGHSGAVIFDDHNSIRGATTFNERSHGRFPRQLQVDGVRSRLPRVASWRPSKPGPLVSQVS
jgi:hypothetical protein